MNIPNEAIPYIIFQRTGYLNDRKFFKLLSWLGARFFFLHKTTVRIKTRLYGKLIETSFIQDIEEDYRAIASYLPNDVNRILDIGSGVAGVDVLLSTHFDHGVHVHLLDKTELEKHIYYNFNQKTAFYNSLDIAKKLLVDNGISKDKIHLHDADAPESCFEHRFDVITSFISWGFHYPVSTYIQSVTNSLTPNGVLILDLRKNTGGFEEIQKYFKEVIVIFESSKRLQVVARRIRNL